MKYDCGWLEMKQHGIMLLILVCGVSFSYYVTLSQGR